VRAVTFAVVTKGPEGLVLAADSRVTLTTVLPDGQKMFSYFDNATKLFGIEGQKYVGVVTFGMGAIGTSEARTAHGYGSEFEKELAVKFPERATVSQVAAELGQFYTAKWTQAGMAVGDPSIDAMNFIVGGFDEGDAYGRLYQVSVPNAPNPVELSPGVFGMSYGGQVELVARLLNGFDPRSLAIVKEHLGVDDDQVAGLAPKWQAQLGVGIPVQFLPLQDCVDISAFLVNVTAVVQRWTLGLRGVGGAVDIATITSVVGYDEIQKKKIQARSIGI
jgi:hypothetical protein